MRFRQPRDQVGHGGENERAGQTEDDHRGARDPGEYEERRREPRVAGVAEARDEERRDDDPGREPDHVEDAEPDDRVEAPELGQPHVANEVRLPESTSPSEAAPAKNVIPTISRRTWWPRTRRAPDVAFFLSSRTGESLVRRPPDEAVLGITMRHATPVAIRSRTPPKMTPAPRSCVATATPRIAPTMAPAYAHCEPRRKTRDPLDSVLVDPGQTPLISALPRPQSTDANNSRPYRGSSRSRSRRCR